MNLTKDEVLKLVVSVCDPNTVSPIEKDGQFVVVTQDELLAFANAIEQKASEAQREKDAKICDGMFSGQVGAVHVASTRCADAIRANKG